jgi:hypothetical protein
MMREDSIGTFYDVDKKSLPHRLMHSQKMIFIFCERADFVDTLRAAP